jgi:hypothetical protein
MTGSVLIHTHWNIYRLSLMYSYYLLVSPAPEEIAIYGLLNTQVFFFLIFFSSTAIENKETFGHLVYSIF